MSMIDRSLDGMAFLSGQLGAILQRRLRELGGIALLSLAMIAALALASWSVDDPSLSHATNSPRSQSARPARRDRRRSDDAAPGAGLAGVAVADRGVGLSVAWPSAASPRAAARVAVVVRRGACGGVCIVLCRAASGGRCRADWAASSATRCCACRLRYSGTPLTGTYGLVAAIVLGLAALAAFGGAAGIFLRGSRDEEEGAGSKM